VQDVRLDNLLFSSIFQVGDNVKLSPRSTVLAMQKELPQFIGSEGRFDKYSIFSKPFQRLPETEQIEMSVHHANPFIQVGYLKVLGMSTAAVVQIGANQILDCENRTKHIRHVFPSR